MSRHHSTLVLMFFGMIVACAGCGDDRHVVQTQPQVQSSPPPPSAQGSANSEVAFGVSEVNSDSVSTPESELPASVAQLPRPEDVSKWSSQEITFAIEERDLRVLEALANYSQAQEANDRAALEIVSWIDLLTQPKRASTDPAAIDELHEINYQSPLVTRTPDSNDGFGEVRTGEGPIGSGVFGAEEVIAEALIDSLIGTRTLTGYQIARDFLAGQSPVAIGDEYAVRLVLTALLKNCSGINCPGAKLLQQALFSPARLRSGSQELDAAALQKIAYEEHGKNSLSLIDGLMGLSTWGVTQMHLR
ncbi:MAG: hypothetical protein HUJ26_05705, partial [Planctomycetaceae bacterium]|nr:hypothetical protein [Planctomycetaceae bacterium]